MAWLVVKLRDEVAPSLGAGETISLAGLAQFLDSVLPAGALDGVLALGVDFELSRAWEPVTPDRLQELVDRARAAEPAAQDVNLEAFLRVVLPDFVDPQPVVDALNLVTDAVELAYVGCDPDLPAVVGTTNPHFSSLGYLQPGPLGVNALRAWQLGADGGGVSIIDIETGWFLGGHEDLPSTINLLAGDNAARNQWHGTATLGVLVATDDAVGGVGLAPAANCDVMSWYNATSGDASPPELAARIAEAALELSAGDIIVLEAQLHADFDGQPDRATPAETDLQVFHAIDQATRIGIVVVEATGNGDGNLDRFLDPTGAAILDRASAAFRESGAIAVGAATSAPPHARFAGSGGSNFGSRVDCYSWGEHILAPGALPTTATPPTVTPSSYWPLDPGYGHTSGATAIIAGVAALVQDLATSLPSGPGRLRSKAMRALLADPQLGFSTSDAATQPVGLQPDLGKIADRFA